MKYVVVLCDGMADYPVPALGGKTPMMVAKKPHIDALGRQGGGRAGAHRSAGTEARLRCSQYERAGL